MTPIDDTHGGGVTDEVAAAKDDPTRALQAGPKDPDHGERPHEYFARVAAATTVRGQAHLEPTTTHYWGGNSEFRSTGVVPSPVGADIDDGLAAEVKRHADLQRVAVEGTSEDDGAAHDVGSVGEAARSE